MSKAIFFDQTYFYEHTEVDENVNWKMIRSSIWNAQEVYIQDILGGTLYNLIRDEIISNNGTLTTARLVTLNDTYIAPVLLNYVMSDIQVPLLYKFREQSTSTNRSEFSTPISHSEMVKLQDYYRLKAERYADKLYDYLCANQSTYTEWTTYATSDLQRAKKPSATTGLYMGQSRTKGYGYEYYEKT